MAGTGKVMDQELLDASRYRITSLSLDSRFADTYFPPSYSFPQENCIPNTGTADFQIRLPTPLKNIMRVSLSSVELPEVEYLFSTKNGNLNFSVQVDAAPPVQLTIPAGNYTSSEMTAQLNATLKAYDPNFDVVLDLVSGKLTFYNTVPFMISTVSDDGEIAARRKEWGIGYYLGFRDKVMTASPAVDVSGYSVTPASILRMQPSAYYLLQLMIPDQVEAITHRLSQGGSVPAFAKLILRDNWYNIQFDDNSNLLRKEFTFPTPVNISAVRLRLLDPWGRLVGMFDMDWSVTLEFYEVTGSRAYGVISRGIGRA